MNRSTGPDLGHVAHALADDVLRAAEHALHAHEHGASALPASPLVIAAYLAHLDNEGLSTSSMDVALAAIVDRHRAARLPLPTNDPAVRDVRTGIRARRGTQPKCKAALRPFDLQEMVSALPPHVSRMRDRALLLVGFGSALHHSELSALRVEHVAWRRSTDPCGTRTALPRRCAARVARCRMHDVANLAEIARVTRHESDSMVRRYIRAACSCADSCHAHKM